MLFNHGLRLLVLWTLFWASHHPLAAQPDSFTVVSAASFDLGFPLSPDSIASGFGQHLAAETVEAGSGGPAAELAGISVGVADSRGTERPAQLFVVSPTQINFLVPPDTATGPTTVSVRREGTTLARGEVTITPVSPGIFSANATGTGVAAAMASRRSPDSSSTAQFVATFDSASHSFVSNPIDLGDETDQVFLSLFATGIRGASGLQAVSATVDGKPVGVQFAGGQSEFAGLDQVNLGPLPRSLAGRGDVEIRLVVENQRANIVTVRIGSACEPQEGSLEAPAMCPPAVGPPKQVAVPAFPGAQGFGAATQGGRGGRVIAVTNLADSGPGSLREALNAQGPRIIVFRVGGTIQVKSQLEILEPFVTIAGQTAPGGGIALRATPGESGQMISIRTHDVVVRYLRIRSGKVGTAAQGQVNIQLEDEAHHVIVDHCSMSWSLDENFNITRNVPDGADASKWPHIFNVSLQRSILAEGLLPHSTGTRVGGEFTKEGWRGVHEISLHHNLYFGNNARNPSVATTGMHIVNNVVYAWGSELGATTAGSNVDWIGNYFKPSQVSGRNRPILHNHFLKDSPQDVFAAPSLFMAGNRLTALTSSSDGEPPVTSPAKRDWDLYEIHYSSEPIPEAFRRRVPLRQAPIPIEIESAEQSYDSVLADVGANARLDCNGRSVRNSDTVDRRYIESASNGTPYLIFVSDPEERSGYPNLDGGTACGDADADGMPDQWELGNGLDPNSDDSAGYALDWGYTNIEVYINGMKPSS